MGIRSALRLVDAAGDPGSPGIASPWATGSLSTIVWSDVFGELDTLPITRAEALAIDAVARARDLLCSTIARCPLAVYRGDVELTGTDAPSWTYRTDTDVPTYHRMLWTVDDLLFTGWSLWSVRTGADGQILDAARVPRELWSFDTTGRVQYDGQLVDAGTVRLIAGPHEGILSRNARALRSAAALDRAYLSSASSPTPDVELHQSDGMPLTRDEIDQLLADWRTARAAPGGAVAYTPAGIDVKTHGQTSEQLLIAGRNAAAVSVARICGVPAALLDATSAGASLEYETVDGRNRQFLDYSIDLFMSPVEACLSTDAWVPRGTRVGFARSVLTELGDPGTGTETRD